MFKHVRFISSWWFQPIWRILVKLDHFPKVRGKHKNMFQLPPPRYNIKKRPWDILGPRLPSPTTGQISRKLQGLITPPTRPSSWNPIFWVPNPEKIMKESTSGHDLTIDLVLDVFLWQLPKKHEVLVYTNEVEQFAPKNWWLGSYLPFGARPIFRRYEKNFRRVMWSCWWSPWRLCAT